MSTAKNRLNMIATWCTITVVPLWCLGLWGFGGTNFIKPYCFLSVTSGIAAIVLLLLRKNYLFWYFIIILLSYFPSMVLGLILNTSLVLILAFGNHISHNLIMAITFLFFGSYCYFPLKYYHDDYYRTEKDRLKSFNFQDGLYDITKSSLLRGDAFSDYYFKSFLCNAYSGIVKLYILFPLSGGAIAIIAGNISKNLQLGIGLFAFFISTITFIQFGIPGFFNAWQVYRLENKYGKKIMIDWGEEE
jgi:hypothetical protein